MVHPVNLCDLRQQADARPAAWAMAAPLAPDERMPMLVPIRGGLGHGLADVRPVLEPAALECERAQHLPPRLNQVQIGRVFGLEDKPPTGVGEAEQQHIDGPMHVEVSTIA